MAHLCSSDVIVVVDDVVVEVFEDDSVVVVIVDVVVVRKEGAEKWEVWGPHAEPATNFLPRHLSDTGQATI